MTFLVDFKRGGADRQTALVDAEGRRRELDAAIVNPETDPATLPAWRAMRKALEHFPPADQPASPIYPPGYWIVTTGADVAEFSDLHRNRAHYLSDQQTKGRLIFDPLGKKSSRVHFTDTDEHERFRVWLAGKMVADGSKKRDQRSKR